MVSYHLNSNDDNYRRADRTSFLDDRRLSDYGRVPLFGWAHPLESHLNGRFIQWCGHSSRRRWRNEASVTSRRPSWSWRPVKESPSGAVSRAVSAAAAATRAPAWASSRSVARFACSTRRCSASNASRTPTFGSPSTPSNRKKRTPKRSRPR